MGEGKINEKINQIDEDTLMFCITLAEYADRPADMLMFLGEYFKEMIHRTQQVKENIENQHHKDKSEKYANKKTMVQTDFFMTYDIVN